MKKTYKEAEIIIESFPGQDIVANSWGGEGPGIEPDPEEPSFDG